MPKKKSTRAKREIKPIGSAKARKQVREITKRVLAHVKKLTPTEAAPVLGVDTDDVRNMRQGNKFSVPMLFKMIRWGKFDATSIIEGPKLKKTRRPMSLTTTQHRLDGRIHTLAWDYPGKTLAEMTGMSVTGAYGLRYATNAHVTLYTVLGFLHAGHSINALVLGR